jgi:hypothetical protein
LSLSSYGFHFGNSTAYYEQTWNCWFTMRSVRKISFGSYSFITTKFMWISNWFSKEYRLYKKLIIM